MMKAAVAAALCAAGLLAPAGAVETGRTEKIGTSMWRMMTTASKAAMAAEMSAVAEASPKQIAAKLSGVQQEWKAEAAMQVACNMGRLEGSDRERCPQLPVMFSQACETIGGAFLKANLNEKMRVATFMSNVCTQDELSGWKRKQCTNFGHALIETTAGKSLQHACGGLWTNLVHQLETTQARRHLAHSAELPSAPPPPPAAHIELRAPPARSEPPAPVAHHSEPPAAASHHEAPTVAHHEPPAVERPKVAAPVAKAVHPALRESRKMVAHAAHAVHTAQHAAHAVHAARAVHAAKRAEVRAPKPVAKQEAVKPQPQAVAQPQAVVQPQATPKPQLVEQVADVSRLQQAAPADIDDVELDGALEASRQMAQYDRKLLRSLGVE